jgi:hypothetical protein
MSESRLVSIHTLANRFEADLLMDALKRESIPATLLCFEETAYDGLFVPQRGWGQILIPAEYVTEAGEALAPLIDNLQSNCSQEEIHETGPFVWEDCTEADT